MTKLRQRMIEDMHLHGFSKNTQDSYLKSVTILARYYWRFPDKITEPEIRKFFLHLVDGKNLSKSTIASYYYGIKFFYEKTLERPWNSAKIPRSKVPKKLPTVLSKE